MEEILQGKPKASTNEKPKNNPKQLKSGSDSGENSRKSKQSRSSKSSQENPDLAKVDSSQKDIKNQLSLKNDSKKPEKNISQVKSPEKHEPKEDQKIPESADQPKPKNKTAKPSKKVEKTSEPEAAQYPDNHVSERNESPDNRNLKAAEFSKLKDSKTLKSKANEDDDLRNEKPKPRAETFKKIEEKAEAKNLAKNIENPSDSEKNSKKSEKSSQKIKENLKVAKKKGRVSEKPDSEDADDEIEGPIMKNPSNNVTEGEILQQLGVISKSTSKLEDQDSYQLKDQGKRGSPNGKNLKFAEDMEETPSFPGPGKNPQKTSKSPPSNDEAIKVNESQTSLPKRPKNQKQTFGDQFPSITEKIPRRKGSSGSENSNDSKKLKKKQSSSSSHAQPENVLGQIFVNKANQLAGNRKSSSSSPETPNLASPVKPTKQTKGRSPAKVSKEKVGSSDSAVWVSPQDEIQKLKQKIKDYEQIIEKQSNEILELKKSQNLLTGPKRKLSPKSSGFLHKRADGTFLQKNPEMLKRDDFDFWKINEEAPSMKEPQKLEDIAALKDLWILNMESGSQLNSNLSGKKNPGVKANPLTKFESNKSANIRNRFLPKISTKKDLSK